VEVLHRDVASIWSACSTASYQSNRLPDIPEDEWHWTSWSSSTDSGVPPLVVVPQLAIAIDAASAKPIDPDMIASDDEPSSVVLELDVIGVIAPVV